MNRKIISSLLFILLINCGFTPVLKDFDISNLKVQKIEYSGKRELIYLIENNLNIKEKENAEGLIVNIAVSEGVKSVVKNNEGTITKENFTISVDIEIFDYEKKSLLKDTISASRRLPVSQNISADDDKKKIERANLTRSLAQKIKFYLQLISKQQR